MLASLGFALTLLGVPANVMLPKGTEVKLAFDTDLSSKTAHVGDKVWFHVEEPVIVEGVTVIPMGDKVYGTVEKVKKRGPFGVNARIQLLMSPIKTVSGAMAPLGFKTKTKNVTNNTTTAAGASAGGMLLLGPVGLVGGYFINGKSVHFHPGDKMTVTVDEDVMVHTR